MEENVRFEGIVEYEGSAKELQENLGKLRGTGVRVRPLPGVPYGEPIAWGHGGSIWPIPFPGIPIPFHIRQVIEGKGFMESFVKAHNPPPIIRFGVDPGIRGGIREFHVHAGNEVFIMQAETFETLVRTAAEGLGKQGLGNTIVW